jgi:hypothetical protein
MSWMIASYLPRRSILVAPALAPSTYLFSAPPRPCKPCALTGLGLLLLDSKTPRVPFPFDAKRPNGVLQAITPGVEALEEFPQTAPLHRIAVLFAARMAF